MKKLTLSLVLLGLAPTVALAADPTVAGSTQIGTHPSYGSSYSGFWRTGADYTVLTDGTNSFVNAPSLNGTIWFRGNNNNWMSVDKNGLTNIKQLLQIGPLTTYGSATFNSNATFSGFTLFNQGFTAHPLNDSSYAGEFSGGKLGVLASGTNYGIQAIGTRFAIAAIGPTFLDGPLSTTGDVTLLNGNAYKPGGGQFLATSDQRLKKDIVDFKLGLAEVERLHPVRYKYNGLAGTSNDGKEYVGVVAQELEKVAPFMVSSQKKKLNDSDKDVSDIKHVDPSAFTYMLVNSVQELASQVRELQLQNRQLQRILCQEHPTDRICHKTEVVARTTKAELANAVE